MKPASFVFGIHNHQPIGNFDEVFEEAYRKTYAPFADVLLKHPRVKWNLHCTGILWEWLEKKHPDYLEKIRAMTDRGQLELLSGGFYEPILPVIPDEDKVGQIEKLSGYLSKRFKTVPKGMWCAERVWEPHLPKFIRKAGIEYTVLDDTHFLSAGLSAGQLAGFYRVEEQNNAVDVFPISQELRYTMPFSPPEKTLDALKRAADSWNAEGTPVLVMADDGEKFGLWPKTYQSVYEEGWLEKFLTLLENNADWVHTETFSGVREKNRPLGRIYLPSASYFEMSEWSLPVESGLIFEDAVASLSRNAEGDNLKRFLKGGTWRNFLAKYPEANSMYKKMLRVSAKVHGAGLSDSRAQEALDRLWAGQCNCSYWHGVFGGLYLPVLRQAIYKNLIEAESLADAAADGRGKKKAAGRALSEVMPPPSVFEKAAPPRIERADFDGDGGEDVLIEASDQDLYLSPSRGGSLFEWDFKPALVNLCNVLTRRPETYHRKLRDFQGGPEGGGADAKSIHDGIRVKEKGLNDFLSYDWYRRSCLVDHFLHPQTTMDSFKRCQYGEQGDFVLGRYEAETPEASSKGRGGPPRVKLFRKGKAWVDEQHRDISVEKSLWTEGPAGESGASSLLRVRYRVTNLSPAPLRELWFAPEFNFAFCVPEPDQDKPQSGVLQWERLDRHWFWKMAVRFSAPADLWIFPLETVSNSEGGFERTFQGVVFLPGWKAALKAGESFERDLTFTLQKT